MLILLSLVSVIGIVPLAVAVARLEPGGAGSASRPPPGSVLIAALAFNLTFLWQESWLAIAKALTPGLWPVLYHNDHDWTGSAPIAELLQGTGAIATMVSGLAFATILNLARGSSPTWRVFAFWMAFQGLFQSLSQFAIGAVIPGNDVGRALAYLGFGVVARVACLTATVAGFAIAGRLLATLIPASLAPGDARSLGATCAAVVLLSIPFRVPRDPVEVMLIPAIVNLIGAAWLLLGITFVARKGTAVETGNDPPEAVAPAVLLVALLLFFQIVLRPGVPL